MAPNYKPTVHLPRTSFPMRASLSEREPTMLRQWSTERVYEQLLDRNRDAQRFVLHDGPPYANGDIHQGHALNKVLKDIVAKHAAMSGRLTDVIPGWDCHGLPIELAVDKQLGPKKKAMSAVDFRRECRRYAEKFVAQQRESFQRLGVFMRWDQPYLTMNAGYEAQTVRELARFVERGSLYRQKKPVYWCPRDRTALAENEIEYDDQHVSPSIYVAMELAGDTSKLPESLAGEKVHLVIWTTTPWTLPANLAIAAGPDFTYVAYRLDHAANTTAGSKIVIVAKDLLTSFLAEVAPDELTMRDATRVGVTEAAVLKNPSKILAFFEGSELAGLQYRHPFIDRVSPVLLGEHVTLDSGTGLVHTAPGHGQDDYILGKQHGLEILAPLDDSARYTPQVEGLVGKYVFDANPEIVELLRASGHLLSAPDLTVTHKYPTCWRCRGPIVFRATDQWFISLTHNDLRRRCLDAIDNDVTWVPHWGKARIQGMMENRPDWCISRQRAWGVPIVVFYCEDCEHCVLDAEVMRHVANRFEQETADAWVTRTATELLPTGFKCPTCSGTRFRKEKDILDVWFDSGVSYANVAVLMPNQSFPVDLYLEGSDQHRGWFNSSLIGAVGTRDRAPYRTVLTHGFVVDGKGEKLSKSKGNGVPMDIMLKEFGADLVRLWVAASDYREDVRLSKEILNNISEAYRKIRNTLRYCLGSVDDFDIAQHAVPTAALSDLDKWALEMTARFVEELHEAYRTFEFHRAYHATVEFCAKTLSAFYFDVLKDRLYTRATNDPMRRGSQTALWTITNALCRMLAPILTFTADEAYRALPGRRESTVFLAGLPSSEVLRKGLAPGEGARLVEKYETLQTRVRAPVQKALEELKARQQPLFKEFKELEAKPALSAPEQTRKVELGAQLVGSSLDAQVVLRADAALSRLLKANEAELPELLIVSQVRIETPEGASEGLSVEVSPASGDRCVRCWCYTVSRGMNPVHPDLCPKCTSAVLTDYPNGLPAAAQV